MKLRDYIKDKRFLIYFITFIMIFISLVVYLDDSVKVSRDNIIYINVVVLILFIFYMFFEFMYLKKYYSALEDIVENQRDEITTSLPEGLTSEQKKYNALIKKVYKLQNERLEKLYVDKIDNSEFITSWVHEVKTPIAVSRLIIENSIGKPMDEVLDNIDEELDRIDNYVEQALYYSKIDEFSKDYFLNEIELEKLVKDLIKRNSKIFIHKRIRPNMFNLELSVLTDKKWLLFIINQVLSNALKYSEAGNQIDIYGEKDDKEKRLIILDRGIGIKPEDLNRVFDKGFTGYNGRLNNKSTGMGLYLAKKMCLKLGHDISIESEHGNYTKVIIHFPKLIDYYNVSK